MKHPQPDLQKPPSSLSSPKAEHDAAGPESPAGPIVELALEDILPETFDGPTSDNLHELPVAAPASVATLTNSPGCRPASSATPAKRTGQSKGSAGAERPAVTSVRRARPVRVDAWAEPASASWTRTRRTVRKVRRTPRSTDWALPF